MGEVSGETEEKVPPELYHDEELVWAGYLIFEKTGRMPSLSELTRVEPTFREDILTVVYQMNRQALYLDEE